MSFTCTLFSDKGRCFNQSERALYGNFIKTLFSTHKLKPSYMKMSEKDTLPSPSHICDRAKTDRPASEPGPQSGLDVNPLHV